jgi:bacterioferritin-associated ferredoxin
MAAIGRVICFFEAEDRMHGATAAASELICSCNGFTAADLDRFIARSGGASFDSLLSETGVGNRCTACLLDVEFRFCEATLRRGQATASAAAEVKAAPVGLKRRLYRAVDRLAPRANLGRRSDDLMPVLRASGIAQYVWIANRSRLFGGRECGPPVKATIETRAHDGRLLRKAHHLVAQDSYIRVNVSDALPEVREGIAVGSVRIARRWRRPGMRGTSRPQVEFVTSHGTCSVHPVAPGMQPETWLTLIWRPGVERLIFAMVNAESRANEVVFSYPFVDGGPAPVSRRVAMAPNGAALHEVALPVEAGVALAGRPFGLRYTCRGRYKPYLIMATPGLEQMSIDHV